MSDFLGPWNLSRQRFISEIEGLSQAQLNWRLYPGALTIAEMAGHVAGVEVMFSSQLGGLTLSPELERIRQAATDGVVNDKPFPFSADEMSPQWVVATLATTRELVEPMITKATDEVRAKTLVSALGPIIDGNGAFARLSFHAAYHQGEAYLVKNAPGFPTA